MIENEQAMDVADGQSTLEENKESAPDGEQSNNAPSNEVQTKPESDDDGKKKENTKDLVSRSEFNKEVKKIARERDEWKNKFQTLESQQKELNDLVTTLKAENENIVLDARKVDVRSKALAGVNKEWRAIAEDVIKAGFADGKYDVKAEGFDAEKMAEKIVADLEKKNPVFTIKQVGPLNVPNVSYGHLSNLAGLSSAERAEIAKNSPTEYARLAGFSLGGKILR